jgi:hypothetical protein
MKIFSISVFILVFNSLVISQIIEKPNFSTATHPMTIERIELSYNQTIISLSIENQTEKGYFCADKNIYLIDALTNKKYKLIKSKDIPVCPETYNFSMVGEVLKFQLIFPKIDTETKYISIVEECRSDCFNIKGVVLDEGFNKDIDLGYTNYASGNTELALSVFQQTLKNHVDYPFGGLYFNIIQILAEKNDMTNAKTWYKKLSNSSLQDKTEVITRLKQLSYYTKLIF